MNIFINPEDNRMRAGWRLMLQFLLMIFISGLAGLLLSYFWQTTNILIHAIPQFLGVMISIWLAARYFDKRPIKDLGLSFDKAWRWDLLAGVLIAAVVFLCIFLTEWFMGWVVISGYGWEAPKAFPFEVELFSSLAAMLMVGFYEELFARGYLITNLSEGISCPSLGRGKAVLLSVAISSVLFGLLHLNNPNASGLSTVNIIFAGVMLAVPYVITGRLGLSMGLHFSWNFMQGSIFGFPVSGLRPHISLIQIHPQATTAPLMTGGAFGPEAGLIGLLGIITIIILTIIYAKAVGYELRIADVFLIRDNPNYSRK